MKHYTKEITDLLRRVKKMARHQQIGVAAMCAGRLYPYCEAIAKYLDTNADAEFLILLDQIWHHLSEARLQTSEITQLLSKCKDIDLGPEASCIFYKGAMSALGALFHTIMSCKRNTSSNVEQAINCAIDVIDGEIMAEVWQLYDRPISGDDDVDIQIALHPKMHRELEWLSNTIQRLADITTFDQNAVQELRSIVKGKNSKDTRPM